MQSLTDIVFIRKGGQKTVSTAIHPTLGKVAYKQITITSPEVLERTKREIRAVKLLGSPNVPTIFEHNCDQVGAAEVWIVEQFIEGKTVKALIESGTRFDLKELVDFLRTMLTVCVLAEGKNLVHRDIKPDNIIQDIAQKFWLIDYGIARHLDLNSITPSQRGMGVFTLGYASSEQFRNLKREIDIRADLFSISVVGHEMVTGRNHYRENTADPLVVLHRMERLAQPPLTIRGDTQFQLSAFLSLLGDPRRTRRPKDAATALQIFNSILPTLRF
jgi:serine/threonine protein kinase